MTNNSYFFSVDGKAKGMMCLVTGKRHLICQDISSAVESLGELDLVILVFISPLNFRRSV